MGGQLPAARGVPGVVHHLSLASLMLLLAGVAGMVLGREQVAGQLAAQLESLMGQAGRELVNSILTTTSPEGGTWAAVVGLATLFIGARNHNFE